jgi:HK97 family phage prohead protease
METGLLDLELKEASLSSEGVFEGILASYNSVDQGGDTIEPGAFTKTLQERGSKVPLLWQHKADMPIGDLFLVDTPTALRAQGKLQLADPLAQKAYLYARAGTVKGLSIGYEPIKNDYRGQIRVLKEIKLYEGSLVTFPMDETAVLLSIKSWLEPLIEAQPDTEFKMGRVLSASNHATLTEVHKHMKAANDRSSKAVDLLSALLEEAGKTTSNDEAAESKSKPDAPTHHLAAKILDDLRSLVPRA